jgi:hypothetical protein
MKAQSCPIYCAGVYRRVIREVNIFPGLSSPCRYPNLIYMPVRLFGALFRKRTCPPRAGGAQVPYLNGVVKAALVISFFRPLIVR